MQIMISANLQHPLQEENGSSAETFIVETVMPVVEVKQTNNL